MAQNLGFDAELTMKRRKRIPTTLESQEQPGMSRRGEERTMFDRTSRRTFLTRTAGGMGVVALSSAVSVASVATSGGGARGGKKLLATTDYCDNILEPQRLFAREQMDALHQYLASIGVSRHQWIVNPMWDLYNGDEAGFDIISEAVKSAHAHGLEFYTEIKPFEGGGFGNGLPLTFPLPEGAVVLHDMRGIYPMAVPFVARHPELCLRRRPGTYEAPGPVTAVRLVKGDDKPSRVKPEHLTLWTSATNNHFERYEGPLSFRESVEWRPTYPKTSSCRILHIEGLEIPENHRYLLIRCALADDAGDFTNERGSLVELAGPDDASVPFILSTGPVTYEAHRALYVERPLFNRIVRYFQMPEVDREMRDTARGREHYRDFYAFEERRKITELYTLDKEGYVGIACGKPEYMLGNLHPIYPEVREHWLGLLQYCLDRGVDGINIRHSNHTQSPEAWEYGFNEAAIEAAGDDTSYPAIRRVNGNAYTQFLREARELIKRRGKSLTLHLYTQMLAPDDRPTQLSYLPPNIEWQWETWVAEIADDLELRGVWTLRPWNLRQVLDTFSAVTRAAGKPLYFDGNQKELRFDGPYEFTGREIDMIKSRPGVDGFVLYETASFTKVAEDGAFSGSSALADLIATRFFGRGQ